MRILPHQIYYVLRKLLLLSSLITLLLSFYYLSKYIEERTTLRGLTREASLTRTSSHLDIVRFRDYVLHNRVTQLTHLHTPTDQENWRSTRPLFRQSALDSLEGRPVQCGEFARVMVAALREIGIPARRLYLYRNTATNHVALEYLSPDTGKWTYLGSTMVDLFSPILDTSAHTIDGLIATSDTGSSYTTSYAFKLWQGIGLKDPPYALSYLIDSPYLLKSLLLSGLALILFTFKWYLRCTAKASLRTPFTPASYDEAVESI